MIDRRAFFSGFWKRGPEVHRTRAERKARYKALETHVQLHFFPNDFALTEAEKSYLWSRVRSFLELTGDQDLFSTNITKRLSQLVEDVIEPLRMASAEVTPNRQPESLRQAAIEKVATFLKNASESEIDTFKTKFSLAGRTDLDRHLRQEITTWVNAMDDSEILKHDSFSIQDPVFARLRALLR
jgi:hypothetical protein